jgi:hypothetical protein
VPNHKYERPKKLVVQVFEGKELEGVLMSALGEVLAGKGIKVTPKMVRRFTGRLTKKVLGGRPVLVVEQYPLFSRRASGRFDELIYAYIQRTGTQYAKKYKVPKNPQTPAQQEQRAKYARAILAWQELTESNKNVWRKQGEITHQIGYNLFVSNYLKNN